QRHAAATIAQRGYPAAAEPYFDIAAGLVAVPEVEAARVHLDAAAGHAEFAGAVHFAGFAISEALQGVAQAGQIHVGAVVELHGPCIDASGQGPLQGAEVRAHAVVDPYAPGGDAQHAPDQQATEYGKETAPGRRLAAPRLAGAGRGSAFTFHHGGELCHQGGWPATAVWGIYRALLNSGTRAAHPARAPGLPPRPRILRHARARRSRCAGRRAAGTARAVPRTVPRSSGPAVWRFRAC